MIAESLTVHFEEEVTTAVGVVGREYDREGGHLPSCRRWLESRNEQCTATERTEIN